MNARHSRFVNAHRGLAARIFVAAGACGLLSACVGNPFEDAKVDPRSPVAAEVAKSVKPDAPYPSLAAIPAKPNDLRPRRQYGVAAAQDQRAADQLAQATADDTWTLQNTEAFAAQAQAAVAGEAPPSATAETEAYAAALRKRATPPPPAKH